MKKLVLVRHAKSDWSMGLDDHQRRLSSRGLSDAALVAPKVAVLAGSATVIWSSSAKRALSTARIFAAKWGSSPDSISVRDDLYTFDHTQLESVISQVPDHLETVFIFGHNEAITDFVNKFGNIYIDNVPTSGVVELLLPTDSWRRLVRGTTGTVIFPKDLKHGQPDL